MKLLPAVLVLALAGCSTAPEPKAEKKAPEPVTGLHALYGMYTHARTWAQDLQVISLRSIAVSQVKSEPGKAAAWQAVFASPALGQQRTYTSCVADVSPSLRQGIFMDPATPLASDSRPFLLAAAKIDTDQAWETALKHDEGFTGKNPGITISFVMQLSRRMAEPVWQVVWGESATSSPLSMLVDAGTGQYLQVVH
jgi:hypothetical protein